VSQGELSAAEAAALGSATRQEILHFLAQAAEPVGVAELTEHLGLNHNAVRKHLARLVEAGLVSEQRETRSARGRPRMLYRALPSSATRREAAYERLSVLLASALATDDDIVDVGRRAGREGERCEHNGNPVEALTARLADEGFAPVVEKRGPRSEITLGRCPFAAAASANPSAVCQLHLGLAQGTVERIGGLAVDSLIPRDPQRAGCRLSVSEAV
jgi:predicted ArsR family transcriptional regulator